MLRDGVERDIREIEHGSVMPKEIPIMHCVECILKGPSGHTLSPVHMKQHLEKFAGSSVILLASDSS